MNFTYSAKVEQLRTQLISFMNRYIFPNEHVPRTQIEASGNPFHHAEIIDELKGKARVEGFWNLFLPDEEYGAGLTNLEYAPLAEIMGQVLWASEVFNCSAPDTGNMEISGTVWHTAAERTVACAPLEWRHPLILRHD